MGATAFYPGTFDPITNGHVDIAQRAAAIADHLVMAIGVHPGKSPMFSEKVRLEMVRDLGAQISAQTGSKVTGIVFHTLAVDAAREAGANMLVRGLRDASDFDYEMQMAGMNQTVAPEVVTVFLPSSPGVRHITATLVRQVVAAGRDVSPFVPDFVASRIDERQLD